MADGALRRLALLVGVALLAATAGTLLGIAGALLRGRAPASGGIVGLMALLAAVPPFFARYFPPMPGTAPAAPDEGPLPSPQGARSPAPNPLPATSASHPPVP